MPCISIIVQFGHTLSTTFIYMYEASRAHEQKVHVHAYAQWAQSMGIHVAMMAN